MHCTFSMSLLASNMYKMSSTDLVWYQITSASDSSMSGTSMLLATLLFGTFAGLATSSSNATKWLTQDLATSEPLQIPELGDIIVIYLLVTPIYS